MMSPSFFHTDNPGPLISLSRFSLYVYHLFHLPKLFRFISIQEVGANLPWILLVSNGSLIFMAGKMRFLFGETSNL
ncbi:hypothetical protein RIF29_21598 [Crotalaria pallida]|uniref:Uncharacterized protein n=1 Tax=Crotalaria pallida TaxID=3830 RepID=A0AAN9F3A2_CROPI